MAAINLANATMTFDDEFNSLSMGANTGTWQPFYSYAPNGLVVNDGWYSNPLYGPTSGANPFSVTNGVLDIAGTATSAATYAAENYMPYTSGVLTTYRSFSQTYGYFEMRAQLPSGQGVQPAFWLI